MIFYFSGTGNSLYVARELATHLKERLVSVAAAVKNGEFEYNLEKDETIAFVYPIYAWAPPHIVLDFINKLKLNGNETHKRYVFSVATCGGSIGNTMKVMDTCLAAVGLKLSCGFSLVMPNNYNIMGDVDSKENEERKLRNSAQKLSEIKQIVCDRKEDVFQLDKGMMSFLQTSLINPMFMKNAIKTEKFYALDSCNGCGICAKVCNCSNINVDKKPVWGNNCVQCLACMHYCPQKAIQYGKGTEKKGRYVNPNIKPSDMFL